MYLKMYARRSRRTSWVSSGLAVLRTYAASALSIWHHDHFLSSGQIASQAGQRTGIEVNILHIHLSASGSHAEFGTDLGLAQVAPATRHDNGNDRGSLDQLSVTNTRTRRIVDDADELGSDEVRLKWLRWPLLFNVGIHRSGILSAHFIFQPTRFNTSSQDLSMVKI